MGEPASMIGQFCKTHDVEVEQRGSALICPRGRHAVSHWNVVNKRTGRVMYAVGNEGEEVQEMNEVRKQAATSRPVSITANKKQEGAKTLRATSYRDGSGQTLVIRLKRVPVTSDKDPFRVTWESYEYTPQKGGKAIKKHLGVGVTVTAPDELAAVKAYDACLRQAQNDGWQEAPAARGYRTLTLKPIPAPRKRA